MGLTVSPPRLADAPQLHHLLTACGNVFSTAEIAVAKQMIDDAMRGEYTILAAYLHGQPTGYCLAGPTPFTASTWHLYWLCVHPDHHRRGVARALQQALENAVLSAGGERIVVETGGRADYLPAQCFYLAVGYSQQGRIENYYRPGDACIYFCKVLS